MYKYIAFFSYTEDLLEKLITIGAFIEVFK